MWTLKLVNLRKFNNPLDKLSCSRGGKSSHPLGSLLSKINAAGAERRAQHITESERAIKSAASPAHIECYILLANLYVCVCMCTFAGVTHHFRCGASRQRNFVKLGSVGAQALRAFICKCALSLARSRSQRSAPRAKSGNKSELWWRRCNLSQHEPG
jgi:hypothetical protein